MGSQYALYRHRAYARFRCDFPYAHTAPAEPDDLLRPNRSLWPSQYLALSLCTTHARKHALRQANSFLFGYGCEDRQHGISKWAH